MKIDRTTPLTDVSWVKTLQNRQQSDHSSILIINQVEISRILVYKSLCFEEKIFSFNYGVNLLRHEAIAGLITAKAPNLVKCT